MNWLENAETQYQRYLDGEINAYEWADIATTLMADLLEMNEEVLDRISKVGYNTTINRGQQG